MKLINEPLVFKPVYKDYLWGGDKISRVYRRKGTPAPCAESWEISAHPDGLSEVSEGSFKGMSLDTLAEEFGAALVGTNAPRRNAFPLLFKIIDAKRKLSVQVHPDNRSAALVGGQPKTEMWYVLGCDEGASLYAGLKDEVTGEDLRNALEEGTVAELLGELKVERDQALFIPGGLVHAIGDGCLIYEVQQNSNSTYRLFDWNRTDALGNPRDLHIEESLRTINWALPVPEMTRPRQESGYSSHVMKCDYFNMKKLDLNGSCEIKLSGSSFIALFTVRGSTRVSSGGTTVELSEGSSALVPAAAESFRIEPRGQVSLLATTL